MLTLKQWMELVDYKITEGTAYGWECFGNNAHCLDSWNRAQDGYTFSITFDTVDQTVYQVEAFDYKNDRAYRMINPTHQPQHTMEAVARNINANEAWDDVDFVDLETDDDFIEKCRAIKAGEDYDTRVSMPVDFTDEELLKYMKLAHERDMTFNQFIEEALRSAIEDYKRDPEGMKARAAQWKSDYDPVI